MLASISQASQLSSAECKERLKNLSLRNAKFQIGDKEERGDFAHPWWCDLVCFDYQNIVIDVQHTIHLGVVPRSLELTLDDFHTWFGNFNFARKVNTKVSELPINPKISKVVANKSDESTPTLRSTQWAQLATFLPLLLEGLYPNNQADSKHISKAISDLFVSVEALSCLARRSVLSESDLGNMDEHVARFLALSEELHVRSGSRMGQGVNFPKFHALRHLSKQASGL